MISLVVFAALAGAETSEEITSKQSQAETVRAELEDMNHGLEAKIENYNYANYQLELIDGNIAANETKLEDTAKQLEESRDRLQKRIVSIYRNGSVDILDVLMDTSDISEFMTKVDMLAKVGQQDREVLEQVKMYKGQLEDVQSELADDHARQSELVDQIASEQAAIEAGIGERESMLSGLEGEIAALEQQRDAEEQAAAEAAAAAAATGSFDGGGDFGPAPAASAGGDVVSIAMQYLGVPYVWGGASPSGFDCSGLVMYVYAQVGINLPHSTYAQINYGTRISPSELAPGDLVFMYGVSHVGIYIGGGSMIDAPYPGAVVSINPVPYGSLDAAVRL